MKVLVTGGAGYIGSVVVKRLVEEGVDTVALDNLEYGHKDKVVCPLIVEDLTNKKELFSRLKGVKFDAVMHFAAYALVSESMSDPYRYFYNNLLGGMNLLEFMKQSSVHNIIFSSSCSVYGAPETLPVTERSSKKPESVYGESKLMLESILAWYAKIYGIKYINLRYFNVAGASLDGRVGEDHNPETHIIPLAIESALTGKPFTIFGKDYDTPDGTCIRDYIHVEDLATVHLKALQKLTSGGISGSYNLGVGMGYSNLEIVRAIEKISGRKIKLKYAKRRAGDPPIVYSDNKKARKELDFIPEYSDLNTVIKSALEWHQSKRKS